ncbi:hypothetical protein GCM10010168_37970 [Actinoplanes ianthinogenes]|uniref:Uncharacterized protein n=1 Tax=Actinoplanes ianthinogenes TaxID=122358 RepID=A0ABM7M4X9_9ACTN|nr:hypothetical protein [Actinoplanes ianthinogenes]BCJ46681.1 hypothetical protein Aiant_73380 [Actinoplanes ianthinogenes]GGR16399.1 hypothetical protein GCM10010168_37970 [Actinoplanes ianthinogenes]
MTLYFDLPRTTPITADPSPWRDRRPSPRLVQATVGSGFLAALLLAAGVWSAVVGDAGAALACGAAVLILGHLCGLLLNLWVRPHNTGDRVWISRIDDGTPGLTFGYSRRLYYWYASFLTLLTVTQATLALRSPALAVGALLTAAPLYVLLRHAPGRLALTPDGVYHHGVWTQQFVPWQAVREILPGEQARVPVIALPATPSPDARVRRSLFRAPDDVAIQVPWLAAEPSLVLQTLRWYHANPAHRFELSFQIAADRVHQRTWHHH